MAAAAAEKETAKESAPEHGAEKDFQALGELTPQSAGIGKWLLVIAEEPLTWEYEFSVNGRKIKGKRLEAIVMSKDATVYCVGAVRRKTNSESGNRKFEEQAKRFKKGSTWVVSKIVLLKETACFISTPLKLMIDMANSQMTPVMAGFYKMPSEPTPPDTLHTILGCPSHQRVDVTALVHNVTPARDHTTAQGPRLIFDITIRDDSGPEQASESKFTIFLPSGEKAQNAYEELVQMKTEGKPVTFFALQCDMDGPKKVVKPDFERFRWAPCNVGPRWEQLTQKKDEVLDKEKTVTVISEIAEFEPKEAQDFINVPARHTTCGILAATLLSGVSLMSGSEDSNQTLWQINHVRVSEPSNSENLLTNNQERLFPLVLVSDRTGSVELRMREKAALELSGLGTKDDFINEAKTGGLNFPILCSLRVNVKRSNAEENSDDLSAIIVEAEPQLLDLTAMPNKSFQELQVLLNMLPLSSNRMIVAPVKAIKHSPHGGMVAEVDGKDHQCSCVLTFIVNNGKSRVEPLANGHRIISKEIWNISFNETTESHDSTAPEHADTKIDGEFASFCTMDNVQYYSLSSTSGKKEPVYALVVISNVVRHGEKMMYMIDKVTKIDTATERLELIRHLKKLSWPLGPTEKDQEKRKSRTFSPSDSATPYANKKSKKMSLHPSDVSLPSPVRTPLSRTSEPE